MVNEFVGLWEITNGRITGEVHYTEEAAYDSWRNKVKQNFCNDGNPERRVILGFRENANGIPCKSFYRLRGCTLDKGATVLYDKEDKLIVN